MLAPFETLSLDPMYLRERRELAQRVRPAVQKANVDHFERQIIRETYAQRGATVSVDPGLLDRVLWAGIV
jgi:hypothetical protein